MEVGKVRVEPPTIGIAAVTPNHYNLGKVSPTFPAALFSVDARFARKIERPQTGRN